MVKRIEGNKLEKYIIDEKNRCLEKEKEIVLEEERQRKYVIKENIVESKDKMEKLLKANNDYYMYLDTFYSYFRNLFRKEKISINTLKKCNEELIRIYLTGNEYKKKLDINQCIEISENRQIKWNSANIKEYTERILEYHKEIDEIESNNNLSISFKEEMLNMKKEQILEWNKEISEMQYEIDNINEISKDELNRLNELFEKFISNLKFDN